MLQESKQELDDLLASLPSHDYPLLVREPAHAISQRLQQARLQPRGHVSAAIGKEMRRAVELQHQVQRGAEEIHHGPDFPHVVRRLEPELRGL